MSKNTLALGLIQLLCGLTLFGGCGGDAVSSTASVDPGTDSQPAPQPLPVIPVTSKRTVALGEFSDPKLDQIGQVAPFATGAPDPAVHDVVVADAQAAGVDQHPTVKAFLDAGKFVVFLNPTAEFKGRLVPLTHVATRADSRLLAVRRSTDLFGRTEFFFFDWPRSDDQADAQYFELKFADFLQAGTSAGSGFNPPPGLVYVTFNYSFVPPVVPVFLTTQGGKAKHPEGQFPSIVSNYQFRLFLDKGSVATGDRQLLAVENDIRASPFNPSQGYDHIEAQEPGGFFTTSDMGWFQIAVGDQIIPQDASDFMWLADSPANANRVTTVTSSINLSIGFLNPDRSIYQYSTSESRQLTSWLVNNLGGGSVGSWQYYNQDPYVATDTNQWQYGGFGGGYSGNSLRLPNPLAASELQCDTQVAWATPGLLSSVEDIGVNLSFQWANAWNRAWSGEGPQSGTFTQPYSTFFSIDMATVLPVPVQAFSFSSNPAPASLKTVTGTVTLRGPARIDTIIFLASSSQNAAPQTNSVTVKAGQTSADFAVLINANGLNPGQQTEAFLTATEDGVEFTSGLTITN